MRDIEPAKAKLRDTIDFYNRKFEQKFKLSGIWETVFADMMLEFVNEQTSRRPETVYCSCPECCEDIEISGITLDELWPDMKCPNCGRAMILHDVEY